MQSESLHALIADVYDVPLGGRSWQSWLDRAATLVRARSLVLEHRSEAVPTGYHVSDELALRAVPRAGMPVDDAALAVLLPHIQRAVSVDRQTSDPLDIAENLTNSLGVGVVVLDGLRVVQCNRRSRNIARETGVFELDTGVLRCRYDGQRADLESALAEVEHGVGSRFLVMGNPDQPVFVSCQRLERSSAHYLEPDGRRYALLLCSHSKDLIHLQSEVLVSFYDMTSREARLVIGLVQGATLQELAESFNVSRHTLRAQLKSVTKKTATHSQAELVGRVYADLPLLFRPAPTGEDA